MVCRPHESSTGSILVVNQNEKQTANPALSCLPPLISSFFAECFECSPQIESTEKYIAVFSPPDDSHRSTPSTPFETMPTTPKQQAGTNAKDAGNNPALDFKSTAEELGFKMKPSAELTAEMKDMSTADIFEDGRKIDRDDLHDILKEAFRARGEREEQEGTQTEHVDRDDLYEVLTEEFDKLNEQRDVASAHGIGSVDK